MYLQNTAICLYFTLFYSVYTQRLFRVCCFQPTTAQNKDSNYSRLKQQKNKPHKNTVNTCIWLGLPIKERGIGCEARFVYLEILNSMPLK